MKKIYFAGLVLGLLCVLGTFNVTNAKIYEGYEGIDFPEGDVSFADEVVSYQEGSGVSDDYDDPSAALGIPDGPGTNAVSLGNQGILELKFTDNSLTASGDDSYDLWIFEEGGVAENTGVYISTDGSNWISVGETGGSTKGVDIDFYTSSGVTLEDRYSYIKLTDLVPNTTSYPYAGADITAVGAISSAPPVPIPGAVWLLGSGLIGIVEIRRKFKK